MKQLLPVWWMMCFSLYRRLSGEKAQSSNPELKISEYPMAAVKVESSSSGLWFDLAFNRALLFFFKAADHCA